MKSIGTIIIISVVLVIMAISNPSKDEFTDWFKQAIPNINNTNNDFATGLVNLLAKPIISEATESKNYVLFSIYETNLDGHDIVTIGIFENFIVVNQLVKFFQN